LLKIQYLKTQNSKKNMDLDELDDEGERAAIAASPYLNIIAHEEEKQPSRDNQLRVFREMLPYIMNNRIPEELEDMLDDYNIEVNTSSDHFRHMQNLLNVAELEAVRMDAGEFLDTIRESIWNDILEESDVITNLITRYWDMRGGAPPELETALNNVSEIGRSMTDYVRWKEAVMDLHRDLSRQRLQADLEELERTDTDDDVDVDDEAIPIAEEPMPIAEDQIPLAIDEVIPTANTEFEMLRDEIERREAQRGRGIRSRWRSGYRLRWDGPPRNLGAIRRIRGRSVR